MLLTSVRGMCLLLQEEEEEDEEEGGIATAIFSLYTDQDVTKRARLHSMTPVFQLLVQCALAGGKVHMRASPPTKRSLKLTMACCAHRGMRTLMKTWKRLRLDHWTLWMLVSAAPWCSQSKVSRHSRTHTHTWCSAVCCSCSMTCFEDYVALGPGAQDALCATLFYGVNWLRALLNTFTVPPPVLLYSPSPSRLTLMPHIRLARPCRMRTHARR